MPTGAQLIMLSYLMHLFMAVDDVCRAEAESDLLSGGCGGPLTDFLWPRLTFSLVRLIGSADEQRGPPLPTAVAIDDFTGHSVTIRRPLPLLSRHCHCHCHC